MSHHDLEIETCYWQATHRGHLPVTLSLNDILAGDPFVYSSALVRELNFGIFDTRTDTFPDLCMYIGVIKCVNRVQRPTMV